MRLEVVNGEKLHRMRGHHGQCQFGRQLYSVAQVQFFARSAVALHFQIIAVGKQPGIFLRDNFCVLCIAVQQRDAHFAEMCTG